MTPPGSAGRFVTLEGGEGVGKSTQTRALAAALRARGLDVVETREPGGSPGAEAIRALLLEGAHDRWTPPAEALLFAAARADHVARTIRPALARGAWVVCDRYLDSSLAYQGGADGLAREALIDLHRIGSDGLLPDRTLVLGLPLFESSFREFARDRGHLDRFARKGGDYHERVHLAFMQLALDEPERVKFIDATGSVRTVTERLTNALSGLLP